MVKLFVADFLVNDGLECDCCVSVVRIKANVIAKDEARAKELVKEYKSSAQIQSLVDKGEAKVGNTGIIVFASDEIFRGFYRDSPLYVP